MSLPEVGATSSICRVILHVKDTVHTIVNSFGLLCEYPYRPLYDPDCQISPSSLINSLNVVAPALEELVMLKHANGPPWPFADMSVYRLMQWMYSGSKHKSIHEINCLVHEVILAEDFKPQELENFSTQKENRLLDSSGPEGLSGFSNNWKAADVVVGVPTRAPDGSGNGQPYTICGLYYCCLVEAIKAVFSKASASQFHLLPFKCFWVNPVTEKEQRVYNELYTSDSWIQAHEDLQKQKAEAGCKLERVIAALMFWSDETHLADFGTSKAWPVYLYFGNISKYTRAQVNCHACHQVAFIPSAGISMFC
ncbi:hypothetical protein SERLA73DRAFT_150613 [Serpula lacrymans var. lacrymans S7.3]|uniref:Uncharacterized protein n=2 Tax=Serpula lacrymans var. lacrymans TaxID=341189 RepID=F8PNC6_SERL3|nr:uncharacterized protein SERLADRAFT_406246 [Serpula lacrymans var. lacrymans S7.9]EGO03108.1 hypothetical protein SERLA73DRAFT_150613 [Serpula lacrymans var. lacrymans S7.3]EGO28867.1 hypothetical protein SERLADRAFT_406246 [Serpula lacrymans var. lacrymans S7.9]